MKLGMKMMSPDVILTWRVLNIPHVYYQANGKTSVDKGAQKSPLNNGL
jgi:hypothetical protein